MKRSALFLCLLLLPAGFALAQRITYSEPSRNDDYRNTEVEIIGQVGDHILAFKNNRDAYSISAYDQDMKLVKNTALTFMPERLINTDFIAYPDHFQLIYQYQYKAYVYCYGITMDANGTAQGDPVMIDSSRVGNAQVKTKIYSVVHSDDRNRIMVYKINQDKNFDNVFYTFLLGPDLNLVNNSRVVLPMKDRKPFLSDFKLSNDGYFLFTKVKRAGNTGNLEQAELVVKPPVTDSLMVYPLELKGKYLDEMKLTLDNRQGRVFLASFFTEQRRGNVEGLFAGEFSWKTMELGGLRFIPFSDELKMNAQQKSSGIKGAFNNYFIRQLVVRSDGGFLLTAESYYSSSRYQPWNRWDYMYSPWGYYPYYSPYYSSPFSPWYYSPYSWNNNRGMEYHYDDIAMLSYGPEGKLEWSNFIPKEQTDNDNAVFLSYLAANTGNSLQFIYNEPFRRSYLLTVVSVTPDGKLSKLPTLRGLDKGYEWMPRYGKQTGPRQVVVPCIFRNYICFAKIDF